MMTKKKILISGASIAGPTLAYWLHKYGFDVKVVERAPELRMGGQNIDLRDAGQQVVEKMGLREAILQKNTGELGLQFIDRDNKVKAQFPATGDGSFTSDMEIVRGDLVDIIVDQTKEVVEYRFGDYITALTEQNDQVVVTYNKGEKESFDLVIAADGVRSATRDMIFGSEVAFKDIGLYNVYLTIKKTETDTKWARWYNAPGSRVLFLRPDNEGNTRASFSFLSKETYRRMPLDEQRKLIIGKLEGIGWEGPRVVKALAGSNDFYFDKLTQVMAPVWSRGRMAMIGDAAYCATPISGMGASLAVIGAYVMAGELAKTDDHAEAFRNYEQLLRPFVKSVQQLPPGAPWIVHPKSKLGVSLLNIVAGIAGSSVVKRLLKLFKSDKKPIKDDEFRLTDYSGYVVR